jgi:hypothetical protein
MYQSIRTLALMTRPPDAEPSRLEDDPPDPSGVDPEVNVKKVDQNDTSYEPSIPIHNHFLVVSMQIAAGCTDAEIQQPTSSMVDVLDLKRIFTRDSNNTKSKGNEEDLALQEFSVPQTPGMELIDSNTVPGSAEYLPKRSRVLASPGADLSTTLCGSDSGDDIMKSKNPRVCVALSDGTVALLSCSEDPRMNEAVGIAEDIHQILLSHPAVGCGRIYLPFGIDNREKRLSYVACCVRSGTCYLIPTTTTTDLKHPLDVAVVPFPHDISSDLDEIYIQAFSAGNLMVNGQPTPVMLYAWPDGVVDVYACGLVSPDFTASLELIDSNVVCDKEDDFVPRVEKKALEEMIDNGTVEILSAILKEMREGFDHPILQGEEWDEVWMGRSELCSKSWTVEMLCSPEFRHVRRLLLSMATRELNT